MFLLKLLLIQLSGSLNVKKIPRKEKLDGENDNSAAERHLKRHHEETGGNLSLLFFLMRS
jgi:hypothetical protein